MKSLWYETKISKLDLEVSGGGSLVLPLHPHLREWTKPRTICPSPVFCALLPLCQRLQGGAYLRPNHRWWRIYCYDSWEGFSLPNLGGMQQMLLPSLRSPSTSRLYQRVDSWKQRNKMPCYQCKEIINNSIVYIFGTTGLVVTWEKLFAGMLMAA